jgi:ABC-2 type transport system ATP-binding protein
LNGVRGADLDRKVEKVIGRVGISYAIDRPVRALSKGMLQRTGLAAALVHDPEMLILDEPMSGLDPVGRKEVRDLIAEEQNAGRTVFFSSHILTDIEMLCDRVCILRTGEVVLSGSIDELLGDGARHIEISLAEAPDTLLEALKASQKNGGARMVGRTLMVDAQSEDAVRDILTQALAAGAKVASVIPKRETLEDIFVRRAL